MASTDSLDRTIDAYFAAWNEPDVVRRKQMLHDVLAENATYTDPRGHAAGPEELSSLIGRVLASRPGAKVVRTSLVDSHHGLARFGWRVVQADGTMLPEGIDFAEVADNGRILRIVGFFGPLVPKKSGRAEPSVAADAPKAPRR